MLPAWLTVPGQFIPELVGATVAWATYDIPNIIGDLFLFGDPLPILELAGLILYPAVLIHLEGGF